MPRIAAALGLVATVSLCIGFNLYRYPKVWEMVAPARTAGSEPKAVAKASADKTAKPAVKPTSVAIGDATFEPSDEEPAKKPAAKPSIPIAKSTGSAQSIRPIPLVSSKESAKPGQRDPKKQGKKPDDRLTRSDDADSATVESTPKYGSSFDDTRGDSEDFDQPSKPKPDDSKRSKPGEGRGGKNVSADKSKSQLAKKPAEHKTPEESRDYASSSGYGSDRFNDAGSTDTSFNKAGSSYDSPDSSYDQGAGSSHEKSTSPSYEKSPNSSYGNPYGDRTNESSRDRPAGGFGSRLERLPAIDNVTPGPTSPYAVMPGDQLPRYPSTGR